MPHTIQVTGTIHTPEGEPWEGFELTFSPSPPAVTAHALVPTKAVTATTGESGEFAIDLEVGIAYAVELTTAFVTRGTSTTYPPGTRFDIVVPADVTGPVSLMDILADKQTPVTHTLLGRITALEDAAAPEGGTTGQALVKASDDDHDMTWGDVASGGAEWGGITGDLGDQQDIAGALDAKADVASLADVATSGEYHDLSGIPETFAPSPHEHQSADITDLADAVRDVLAAALVAGDNVTITAGESTITISAEGGGGLELAGDGTAETAARSNHWHSYAGDSSRVSVGRYASAGPSSVAIGNSAAAPFASSVAIGQGSSSTAARAMAIGANAKSTIADTAVIRANRFDFQRSQGAGETEHIIYSPDGTAYIIGVEDDGTLTVTEA